MKPLKLFTFLILTTSYCFAQTLTDSAIYITHKQAKTVNLMANELDKFIALDSACKDLIKVKEQKIETLLIIQGIKGEQLGELRVQNEGLKSQVSSLKKRLVLFQILAVSASVVALLASF